MDNMFASPSDTAFMPHFGQKEILDSVLYYTMNLPSFTKSSVIGEYQDNITFHIPLKIWILQNDDESLQAIGINEVSLWLEQVNDYFSMNNTGIEFYLKCTPEIISSTEYNILDDDEFDDLYDDYNESEALDFYMVHTANDWEGRGPFPWDSRNFRVAVEFSGSLSGDEDFVSVHELGHSLGLLHTHENIRGIGHYNGDASTCYQESVSRTRTQGIGCTFSYGNLKCEINGDALCDTDAAPNHEGEDGINIGEEFIDANASCGWGGSGEDNWGDTWIPPISNIMSYVHPSWCQTEFTLGQVAVMHSYILLDMNENGEPWYNLHGITLSGSVHNLETEITYSPEVIVAPTENLQYTLEQGAYVELHAGSEVTFKPGFHAQQGAQLIVSIDLVENCSSVFSNESFLKNLQGLNSEPKYTLINEDLEKCRQMLLRALNRNNKQSENTIQTNIADKITQEDGYEPQVYPNPFTNELNFKLFSLGIGGMEITILSSNGQIIKNIHQENIPSGEIIITEDLSDQPEGIYLYKIVVNNCVYSGKFIK
ncbi:MAG: T9SS type A sorting domain-containing protein [Bacteroidales bacterium]|nr:T9SS type A sorting domain-containing protein [Bacteroidales bacterium]MDT8431223.1 T9SS type A sorting domain-containing protein [Bacteroidales bacterium]